MRWIRPLPWRAKTLSSTSAMSSSIAAATSTSTSTTMSRTAYAQFLLAFESRADRAELAGVAMAHGDDEVPADEHHHVAALDDLAVLGQFGVFDVPGGT